MIETLLGILWLISAFGLAWIFSWEKSTKKILTEIFPPETKIYLTEKGRKWKNG